MSTWKDLSGTIVNFAQALGIVIGGIWVYYKFFRNRTYARRAELDVDAVVGRAANHLTVRVTATLKNVGLSRLPLKADRQIAFLYGRRASEWTPSANLHWDDGQPLILRRIFTAHEIVEAQETIQDEVVFALDDDPTDRWLAFRVKVLVVGQSPWYRDKPTAWVTNRELPAGS